ncbi:MAG TPA: rhomboid family intramembrane serine protease [Candidatus Sulfotelmatobacter sp.]
MPLPEPEAIPQRPFDDGKALFTELANRGAPERRSIPKWTEFPNYPVITCTAVLAVAATIAWWSKVNVSLLFPTAMIRRGEFWRLITSNFLHGNILHLAFNIYWLWVFGTLVERVYGHLRTTALIALFALGSSFFQFAFSLGGIGLSGVGYGLFGLLWVLSRRDDHFRNSISQKTIQVFVVWFFFCIAATVMRIFSVGNIAHGVGAILGILTGFAITMPRRRTPIVASVGAILLFGLWGSTLGRPRINLSTNAGYEEWKWGYDALLANRDQEAVRWLRDAVVYQPKLAGCWFDLGIAYQRLGNGAAASAAYQRAHELEPNNEEYMKAALGAAEDLTDAN